MGFYEKMVLPRLLDLAMRNSRLADYRQETIRAARGVVLEIGIGSGLNLPLYGAAVDRVCGIDPSPELLNRASERTADAHATLGACRNQLDQIIDDVAAFDEFKPRIGNMPLGLSIETRSIGPTD